MFTPTFTRRVSQLLLLTFTSLTLQPLQAAVMGERQKGGQSGARAAEAPKTEAEKRAEHLSSTLGDMDDLLREISPQTKTVQPSASTKGKPAFGKQGPATTEIVLKPQPGVDVEAHVKKLRDKYKEIAILEDQAEQDFGETEKHLRDSKLPQVILDRQQAAVIEFRKRRAEFDRLVTEVADADDMDKAALPAKLKALNDFMEKHPNHKVQRPVDPNRLPFGKEDGKVRPPKKTEREYHATLFKPEPVMLAGPIPNGFILPTTTLPYVPTAADLAPTEDIVLTPAIKAQASALNNNPVQIYNWVRNNIEYLPTYGSIQGADMTLQTKRGNDMDTASLLIALLRAANIPARYVYGTIQLPADKAMNWVGGVTVPEAALQLMGQGGIPSVGIFSGGRITSIQLEHVWVEAWVDYTPSRGAINKNPDTWVVMDPSFKQHTYTQGMNIAAKVPFNAQSMVSAAQTGAVINPSGWVQNVNASAVQAALTNYQIQVQNYINTTKPGATVGDVIGAKTIIPENYPILLGTLPYKIIASGAELTSIPPILRHQFEYDLYATAMDRAMGNAAINYQISLPSLGGKKVTLSFAPATATDASLIASYLPAPNANGTPILPSQLPTSLPAYLIHLNAELRVDGQAVAVAGPFTMGDSLVGSQGLYDPVFGWRYADDTSPTAGEYIATHVDLQGVSAGQIQTLKDRMIQTQVKIQTQQVGGLTKDDLSGDVLYNAVLTYFAANQAAAKALSRTMGIVDYRKPSFGNFSTSSKVQYWFGIAKGISFPGLIMDINRYASMNVAKDNNMATAIAYNKQIGVAYSANEHLTPERLYSDTAALNQPQGVSAVKALAIADAQGQKIYTLNVANQGNHAALLAQVTIDAQAMTEIQNALAAGKEVTVHQTPITQNGWTGSGYIITDPGTGTGAYKIAGGANGAWWSGVCAGLSIGAIIAVVGLMVANVLATAVGGVALFLGLFSAAFLGLFALLLLTIVISVLMVNYFAKDDLAACFWGGFGLGNAAGGLIPGQAYLTAVINFIIAAEFAKSVDNATYNACVK